MSDLISRHAAIDEIDEWIKAFRENVHKESAADARFIRDGIIQLPSAQPRKGAWIDEGQYAEGHGEHAYYCSQCEEHYIGWIGEFSFCPNCGSDMRG